MTKEINLPDLGEGIEGAEVSDVVVSAGQSISKMTYFSFWNLISPPWKYHLTTLGRWLKCLLTQGRGLNGTKTNDH